MTFRDYALIFWVVVGGIAMIRLALFLAFPKRRNDDDDTPYGDTTGWPKH